MMRYPTQDGLDEARLQLQAGERCDWFTYRAITNRLSQEGRTFKVRDDRIDFGPPVEVDPVPCVQCGGDAWPMSKATLPYDWVICSWKCAERVDARLTLCGYAQHSGSWSNSVTYCKSEGDGKEYVVCYVCLGKVDYDKVGV